MPKCTTGYYYKDLDNDYLRVSPKILLRTRTGEKIFMRTFQDDSRYYEDIPLSEIKAEGYNAAMEKWLIVMKRMSKNGILNEVSPYFKTKTNVQLMSTLVFGGWPNDPTLRPEANVDAYCDFSTARKYEDKERGFKYILLKKTNDTETKDIALSMYDDYLLDTYAIRDWYNSMPSVDMNYDTLLRTHRVIGL